MTRGVTLMMWSPFQYLMSLDWSWVFGGKRERGGEEEGGGERERERKEEQRVSF